VAAGGELYELTIWGGSLHLGQKLWGCDDVLFAGKAK
jgi:hypothetical protein